MENTIINALDEQFKAECKVIDLKYEYSGYTGEKRFAVITALSEQEILEKYPEQIKPYIPFMILSPAFGEVRTEYRRNEKKHEMRAVRKGHIFGFDDDTELANPELAADGFEDSFLEIEQLKKAVFSLPEQQRRRVYRHFFLGMSFREIARIEGVSHRAVIKSIEAALAKLKKFLD